MHCILLYVGVRYPHEQTVRRKVLMPHFQRMAMEERILQGHARFQLATEEGPPRKCGRPCKTPSAFTGKCQCGVLIQNTQENRSVAGYTEDFINQAKLCKPKNAETWCGWYKNGLRKDIQAQLRGVLEPLEFALVRRMAGFAMEAEEKIAANVAASLSSIKEGNPGRDAEGQEKPRKVRDYLKEFLDTAKRCQPKPAEEWCQLFRAGLRGDIREELMGVLEPLEFALVKRMASQALHAEEWLAEGEAEAEYDRFAEGEEYLGPETRCASPCQCG
ncbi:hypothetical protein F2Q70_00003812 [Brassica cretica]|uniref:Uncharacterized protein n=1 Tax=Brassica cretica TaxID=69181 RepID=A0A8S9IQH3_BRACR|nr:hypothetical protein F2Q70_00003812 [Brassica cretica]